MPLPGKPVEIGGAEEIRGPQAPPDQALARFAILNGLPLGLPAIPPVFSGVRRQMAPRAFISFQIEDRWARDFLVRQAKDGRTDVEFLDYSVKDPFDTAWKTNCKKQIARTHGTIVLIGPTTYRSDAVLWEIQETNRQQHY